MKIITTFEITPDINAKLKPLLTELCQSKKPGFLRILEDDLNWNNAIKWSDLLREKYKQLVVIGIGGSSMGGRAIANYTFKQNIFFLDNIDPAEIQHIWTVIEPDFENTAFLIISKSGASLEIATLIETYSQLAQNSSHNFFKNSFIITENKPSFMTDLAEKNKIPVISMPEDVGGRFSVLTPVGMVIAGFLGLDINQIRSGANLALKENSLILQIAAELIHAINNKIDLFVFWSYSSQLRWFNQWLYQLWAESLGKTKTRSGQKSIKIPWMVIATGASDQHSIYQHILESEQTKYVLMTQSLKSFPDIAFKIPQMGIFKNKGFSATEVLSAERSATASTLKEFGVPVTEILFENYNDEAIGYLFLFFETLIVTVGEYFEINPYDQPAVQHGKNLALQNLNLN